MLRRKIRTRKLPTVFSLIGMLTFGAVGSLVLLSASATTPAASIEAENGSLLSSAVNVADTTASNGHGVKFSSSSSGGCPSSTANAPDGADAWGGCWPGPTTTGVPSSITLKRVPEDVTTAAQAGGKNSGWHWDSSYNSVVIDTNTAVIDSVRILGSVNNSGGSGNSNHFVLSNSMVWGTTNDIDTPIVRLLNGTVTDTDIGPDPSRLGYDGKAADFYTQLKGIYSAGSSSSPNLIQRVNVHNVNFSLWIDGETTVSNSWLHALAMGDISWNPDSWYYNNSTGNWVHVPAAWSDGSAHTDAIFMTQGTGLNILHSTIGPQAANNSYIFGQQSGGTPMAGTISRNNFIGSTHNGQTPAHAVSYGTTGNVTLQDNYFNKIWEANTLNLGGTHWSVSNNKYTDGSAVVPEYY